MMSFIYYSNISKQTLLRAVIVMPWNCDIFAEGYRTVRVSVGVDVIRICCSLRALAKISKRTHKWAQRRHVSEMPPSPPGPKNLSSVNSPCLQWHADSRRYFGSSFLPSTRPPGRPPGERKDGDGPVPAPPRDPGEGRATQTSGPLLAWYHLRWLQVPSRLCAPQALTTFTCTLMFHDYSEYDSNLIQVV